MMINYLQITVQEMLHVYISVCQNKAANSRTVNPFSRHCDQHQFSPHINTFL